MMGEQTPHISENPHAAPDNPPAVTIEWPEGSATYIAATPIVDVTQGLLVACKALVEALARHTGAGDFFTEDAQALNMGRTAIAQAEAPEARPGA
jgi:hypothetical protein